MMIRKRLTLLLLAVSLSACGEQDGAKEGPGFFHRAVEQTLSLFKSEPDRDEAQKTKKQADNVAQSSEKALPAQRQLPRMPDHQSDDRLTTDDDVDEEEIEQYRDEYDQAIDADEKAEALIALVQTDEKNAVDLLQEAFASPEPELRREAVVQMQDFVENEQVVEMLLKALEDTDPDVVLEAIDGLSELENKRVVDELAKIARTHSDETVREAAQDAVNQEREFEQ